ncbi:TPA: O-methyltransferase [Stenotrophomonas maltophilia]|nr:O-methyltransferase [Stenotrophomonas maltophilia]HEL3786368.1 O-methyltransferase [Stenotrophomonas maltophilia]
MNTLMSSPVAPLLQRLFEEANTACSPALTAVPADERQRLLASRNGYTRLYRELLKDLWLPVSPETGRLLYLLARSSRARSIVEFGTSFGISSIHLAAALRDNGGGRLITTEFEPDKAHRAAAHLREAGLADLVELRVGDALQTLAADLPESIDLVLLDGAKVLYPEVLDLLQARLRPGALVLADNADDSPVYLQRVRSDGSGYLTLPFTDDVELSMRLD